MENRVDYFFYLVFSAQNEQNVMLFCHILSKISSV